MAQLPNDNSQLNLVNHALGGDPLSVPDFNLGDQPGLVGKLMRLYQRLPQDQVTQQPMGGVSPGLGEAMESSIPKNKWELMAPLVGLLIGKNVDAFKTLESEPVPMKNPIAIESNQRMGIGMPEDVFYHGSPRGDLSEINSPTVGKDPNAGLGSHFSVHPNISASFASGDNGALYSAKLLVSNPRNYYNETQMNRELFLEGLHGGELQKAIEDHGTPMLQKLLRNKEYSKLVSHPDLESEDIWGDIPAQDRTNIQQRFLSQLMAKGHDAIVYGNEAEGYRLNPSVITLSPSQVQIVGKIPKVPFKAGSGSQLDPDQIPAWSRYNYVQQATPQMDSMVKAVSEHRSRMAEGLKTLQNTAQPAVLH